MVAVHHLLGGDALLAGANGDGHAMLVATAYKQHGFALQAEIADIDVRGYIYACEVSDMHGTVGIGQGCSYKSTLKCHSYLGSLCFLVALSLYSTPMAGAR